MIASAGAILFESHPGGPILTGSWQALIRTLNRPFAAKMALDARC